MGLYDTVMVPCPDCGHKEEFQSKSGECILSYFELEDCPFDVMIDINRHSPYTCHECRTMFQVNRNTRKSEKI